MPSMLHFSTSSDAAVAGFCRFLCFQSRASHAASQGVGGRPALQSAPGPRRDPPERVGTIFAIRWFPTLRCTLPHITFSSGHLLRWVYLQVPCDSSRAKGGVLGASEIENGPQNAPKLAPKPLLFLTFCDFDENHENLIKPNVF